MVRTKRHKYLQISVFFLIYSIIHVLSATEKKEILEEKSNINENNQQEGKTTTTELPKLTTTQKFQTTSSTLISTSSKSVSSSSTSTTTTTENSQIYENGTENSTTTEKNQIQLFENSTSPTQKCTTPAIEQFPRPLMGNSTRKHGGVILHLLVAIYTFFGLAIVCDEYFVASLDRICEELKMAPDVAGATFMAAGSSAPELATVIIGVFLAKDDIGISGVIGSAVFNIMFVISICGLFSGTVAYLNWWPMVRDCFFYAVSVLILIVTIFDERITRGESIFMLLIYVVYCVFLHFNTPLERWAQSWPVPCKKELHEHLQNEQTDLVTYKNLEENGKKHQTYGGITPETTTTANVGQQQDGEFDFNRMWEDPNFGNQLGGGASVESPPPAIPQQIVSVQPPANAEIEPSATTTTTTINKQDVYRPKEIDPSKLINPLIKPEDPNLYVQAKWYLIFPIHYMCRKTMPDCRTEKYKNWYPFTFFVSMVWISFYSYFMVWMITIIGFTLNIPDTVMGLTFVAAGVSVPDALSSIAVIKEGYGDMAVSNAVGSNVFDILICLGFPWFLKTAIISPGSQVKVISKGLTYSTILLLSTVIYLLVTTHLNGWKLDKRLGLLLMGWYLVFIVVASMYELNVFGPWNPRECYSDY